jgi:hypothetical protein
MIASQPASQPLIMAASQNLKKKKTRKFGTILELERKFLNHFKVW